jgi:peptide/nickel transport system substrate-binding protein
MVNPAVNFTIRGNGDKAWFGWPTDAKMEELREAWFNAPDAAASKRATEAVQKRAFEFVPLIPTGQFILPTAYRKNITGLIIAPINLLWNVEKK